MSVRSFDSDVWCLKNLAATKNSVQYFARHVEVEKLKRAEIGVAKVKTERESKVRSEPEVTPF